MERARYGFILVVALLAACSQSPSPAEVAACAAHGDEGNCENDPKCYAVFLEYSPDDPCGTAGCVDYVYDHCAAGNPACVASDSDYTNARVEGPVCAAPFSEFHGSGSTEDTVYCVLAADCSSN